MKKLFVSLLLVLAAINANADSVYLSNDTLFCNMTNDEVGTLKAKVLSITSALDEIHTLVLSGYVSQADEDFIHTLGKDYALANLDMTNLYSSLSSGGLEGCVKLKSVKYSKHWTLTGHCLFVDCSNLSEVVFPDESECALTKFSSGTFRGCSSLRSITIPAGIKSMDTQVFYLCNNLLEIHCKSGKAPLANEDTFDEQFSSATIYVPKGAIGNYKTSAGWCLFNNLVEDESSTYTLDEAYSENIAFSGDTLFCNLTNDEVGQLRASVFHIGKDLKSIKNAVLSGYIDSSDGSFLNALASAYNLASLDCTNLHSDFANRQFQGCNKLKNINFSRYWTSTGWYLFEDCVNLENIIFPENHVNGGYSEFDGGTFRGCFSLESIEIPATVKKVDGQCFYLCSNLKKIIVKALTPPDAAEDSFGNQFSVAQLIVPKGTQLSYKTAAGWTLFQKIVESSDDVEIKEDEISENVHFADGVLYANLPYNEVGRLKATVLAKVDDLSQIKTAIISNCIDSKDANFLNALASTYSLSTIDFTELKSDFSNFAFQGCEKLESVKYSKYLNFRK